MRRVRTDMIAAAVFLTAASALAGDLPELSAYLDALFADKAGQTEIRVGMTADTHYVSKAGCTALAQAWTDAGCAFAMIVGDLGYDLYNNDLTGVERINEWRAQFDAVAGHPPVLICIGNHEMGDFGISKRTWLETWYPDVTFTSITGDGNAEQLYFYFDCANTHFVCLDAFAKDASTTLYEHELSPEQYAWLQQDLAANADKNVVVFNHAPFTYHNYDTPYYLMLNGGQLHEMLGGIPGAQYLLVGHLHHDNLCILGGKRHAMQASSTPHVLHVNGSTQTYGKWQAGAFVEYPAAGWFDWDAQYAAWSQDDGTTVTMRIAEESRIDNSRTENFAQSWVAAENGVSPVVGATMMKFTGQNDGWFMNLSWFAGEFDVEIVPGMKLSYYVRNYGSVADNVLVEPEIENPDGAYTDPWGVSITDASGIKMCRERWNQAPSLQGLANGTWYYREFDLSSLAGGWAHRIHVRAVVRPEENPGAGDVAYYIDGIKLTWPSGAGLPVLSVSSSSHPAGTPTADPDPQFSWTVTNGVTCAGYSYELDQIPGTLPDETAEGAGTSASYTGVADGTWYFHVRGRNEGGGWGPAAHYQIVVQCGPVNQAPAASDGSVTVDAGASVDITLSYTDPDGPPPYTFAVTQQPQHGSLTGAGPGVNYTPEAGYTGADSFRWVVTDGDGAASNEATVSVTVVEGGGEPVHGRGGGCGAGACVPFALLLLTAVRPRRNRS